jgi:hypothetical protein
MAPACPQIDCHRQPQWSSPQDGLIILDVGAAAHGDAKKKLAVETDELGVEFAFAFALARGALASRMLLPATLLRITTA